VSFLRAGKEQDFQNGAKMVSATEMNSWFQPAASLLWTCLLFFWLQGEVELSWAMFISLHCFAHRMIDI